MAESNLTARKGASIFTFPDRGEVPTKQRVRALPPGITSLRRVKDARQRASTQKAASADVVDCLSKMLVHARRGEITGLAFVANVDDLPKMPGVRGVISGRCGDASSTLEARGVSRELVRLALD